MRSYYRYISVILLLFAALVILEHLRPKQVDWTQTFTREDKIPFGTYALYDMLPDLFPGRQVHEVREPMYMLLGDSAVNGNYISINQLFEADSLDTNQLLAFVHRGNQAFIAAEFFSSYLIDSLHFDTEELETLSPDSVSLYFTSQPDKAMYRYPKNIYQSVIFVDSLAGHTALGRNKAGHLTFMKVPFGKGWFYISSTPLAFTNYQLLTQNQSQYAATALSHLPVQTVYWDEYYKLGRDENQSIFRVLFQHQSLTWSYYIALASIILFLLFKSKRTQRIIPVVAPPRNTTLDFVKAISSLYFNNGDHKNIAEKKIAYFMEHLRLHYFINATTLDAELIEKVAAKSGADQALVTDIFNLINSIWHSQSIGAQTLMMLNNYLEDFNRQTALTPKAKV